MSDLPKLIGVCGKKGSGKDTLGEHLVAVHGYTRFAFADLLKQAVVALDPWVPLHDDIPGLGVYRLSELIADRAGGLEELKNELPEVRRLLQAMGNEVGQGIFGPYFWVDQVLDRVLPSISRRPVVITDVRYPHEGDRIHAHYGKVIRVKRPSTDEHGDMHASETAVDLVKYDALVVNDSTIAAYLADSVEALRGI